MKDSLKDVLEKIVSSTVKFLSTSPHKYHKIIIHNSDTEKIRFLDNLFLNNSYVMKNRICIDNTKFYPLRERKEGEYLIDLDGCLANPTIIS